MANPTESGLQDQIGKSIRVLEDMRVEGANFITNFDSLIAALEGPRSPLVMTALDGFRSSFAALFTPAVARSFIDPSLQDYALVKGFRETDPVAILRRLREDFADNAKDVNSGEFSFGTISAVVTPNGTGTINRLTVDEDGFDIEAGLPETKTFRCIRDEHSGAQEHEEVFLAYGAPAERDLIAITGSGKSVEMAAISARTSLLRNSSFDQYTGTASSSPGIPGWTISTAANVQIDTAEPYRGSPNVTSPASLQLDDNVSVTQNLNVQRLRLDPEVPYYCQVAYNREDGSGDGVLTLTLGSVSAAVTLSAQTGWNVLRIAIGSNCWMRNWNKEDPTVDITLSSRTSGTTLIDDVILAPFYSLDNLWFLPVGGVTPWLLDDEYTVTDTATNAGIVQRWLRRAYGMYLPHQSDGSETWSDPS